MKKIVLTILSVVVCFALTACKSSDYKAAEKYLSEEKYDVAIEMFETLGDYKDSASRVSEAKYHKAEKLLTNDEFDDAMELFEELGEYNNSAERILATKYAKAEFAFNAKDLETALYIFEELREYSDSAERVLEVKYKEAEEAISQENLEQALALFVELGDYKDSATRAAEVNEMMQIHATAVTLNENNLSIGKGKSGTLIATMEPSDTTDIITKWTSSDETVATVDSEGVVTAVTYGKATITVVTSNGLIATCDVTVPKPSNSNSSAASTASAADKALAKAAYNRLKSAVKFPDTLRVHNVWAYNVNTYDKIEIEYSAENNYGQTLRKFYIVTFKAGNIFTADSRTDCVHTRSDFLGTNVRNLGAGSIY